MARVSQNVKFIIFRAHFAFAHFSNLIIFFADYLSRAQGLSKSVSNIIDLKHNKEIEIVFLQKLAKVCLWW